MTVKELKRQLEFCDENDRVVILLSGVGGPGARASLDIKDTICNGYDHECGRVYLYPDKPMFLRPRKVKKG